jgi:hypothetical protein
VHPNPDPNPNPNPNQVHRLPLAQLGAAQQGREGARRPRLDLTLSLTLTPTLTLTPGATLTLTLTLGATLTLTPTLSLGATTAAPSIRTRCALCSAAAPRACLVTCASCADTHAPGPRGLLRQSTDVTAMRRLYAYRPSAYRTHLTHRAAAPGDPCPCTVRAWYTTYSPTSLGRAHVRDRVRDRAAASTPGVPRYAVRRV